MQRVVAFGLSVAFCCSVSRADMSVALPQDVPPVVGTAVATGDTNELKIKLTCPRAKWRVVGHVVPKSQWPELHVEMESTVRTLTLGGPSALAESRVVDLSGNNLDAEDILDRMESETPVLVSVSGKMVDPYYLQLAKPDTLVVLLGARDGVPVPTLLPTNEGSTSQSGVVPAVYDERPRWKSVLIRDRIRPKGRVREFLGFGNL